MLHLLKRVTVIKFCGKMDLGTYIKFKINKIGTQIWRCSNQMCNGFFTWCISDETVTRVGDHRCASDIPKLKLEVNYLYLWKAWKKRYVIITAQSRKYLTISWEDFYIIYYFIYFILFIIRFVLLSFESVKGWLYCIRKNILTFTVARLKSYKMLLYHKNLLRIFCFLRTELQIKLLLFAVKKHGNL